MHHRHLSFSVPGALTVLAMSAAMGIAPVVTMPAARPQAVPPRVTTVDVQGVDAAALREAPPLPSGGTDHDAARTTTSHTRPVAVTAPRATRSFRVLGATWSDATPAGTVVWVRTRHDGTWSGWQELDSDDSHAPDAGTSEAAHERNGTTPLVVEPSDGVQVRVDSSAGAPKDLSLDLVDPGTSAADVERSGPVPGTAQAAGSRPAIRTRAEWGADESLRKAPPSYGTVRVGFVHHTAGTNSYTQAEVPAIIRGIYAFHVKSRGWNDIGYNFLVDKWGRMWEGRYGGMHRPVIGAHTGGYNSNSFAMAALGTYTSVQPSSSVLTAYNQLYAWKLSLAHVDPRGSTVLTDYDGSPTRTYRNISGHRDYNDGANNTECPGDALYAKVDGIRSAAKALQGTEFYRPSVSRAQWEYGAGGVSVQGALSRTATYTVKVVSACQPGVVVATQTGTASGGTIATWNGRLANGSWAPPGGYVLNVYASTGTGTVANATPWVGQVEVTRVPGAPVGWCPVRLGGRDRYAVSAAVAQAANPSSRTVVLASGAAQAMGDALVSGPLARAKNAALLLTTSSALPSSVAAQITARRATTAYLVGGTGTIGTAVEAQLRSLGVATIVRYGGANRFEVAAAVAKAVAPSAPDVMVASGQPEAFADGLVLSGPAAALRRPILLVQASGVPAATAAALTELGVQRTVVAGGRGTVPDAVLAELPDPERLGGASRYEVSTTVATWARGKLPVADVVISSGRNEALADALSAGQLGRPTLYVAPTGVPSAVAQWLDSSPDLASVTVVGGTGSVPDSVAGRAQQAVAT